MQCILRVLSIVLPSNTTLNRQCCTHSAPPAWRHCRCSARAAAAAKLARPQPRQVGRLARVVQLSVALGQPLHRLGRCRQVSLLDEPGVVVLQGREARKPEKMQAKSDGRCAAAACKRSSPTLKIPRLYSCWKRCCSPPSTPATPQLLARHSREKGEPGGQGRFPGMSGFLARHQRHWPRSHRACSAPQPRAPH